MSVFVCKYHVSDMTCINLPCKISIDVSLRTTAHCYIEDVPFREVDTGSQELILVPLLLLVSPLKSLYEWQCEASPQKGISPLTPRDTDVTQIAAVWWPFHPGLTSVAVRPFVT